MNGSVFETKMPSCFKATDVMPAGCIGGIHSTIVFDINLACTCLLPKIQFKVGYLLGRFHNLCVFDLIDH